MLRSIHSMHLRTVISIWCNIYKKTTSMYHRTLDIYTCMLVGHISFRKWNIINIRASVQTWISLWNENLTFNKGFTKLNAQQRFHKIRHSIYDKKSNHYSKRFSSLSSKHTMTLFYLRPFLLLQCLDSCPMCFSRGTCFNLIKLLSLEFKLSN